MNYKISLKKESVLVFITLCLLSSSCQTNSKKYKSISADTVGLTSIDTAVHSEIPIKQPSLPQTLPTAVEKSNYLPKTGARFGDDDGDNELFFSIRNMMYEAVYLYARIEYSYDVEITDYDLYWKI